MIRKTFKNCVFPPSCRRTELRSQEVNKRSYLNNGVACVFEFAYCVLCDLHMYNVCDWYGYTTLGTSCWQISVKTVWIEPKLMQMDLGFCWTVRRPPSKGRIASTCSSVFEVFWRPDRGTYSALSLAQINFSTYFFTVAWERETWTSICAMSSHISLHASRIFL